MHIQRSILRSVCRAAAMGCIVAGGAATLPAQQTISALNTPFILASGTAPADLFAASTPTYSSSSATSESLASLDSERLSFGSDANQPPPRRTYGRPKYSDSHTNADGSNKYTFLVGIGLTLPSGNTHKYETPSYGFQAGFGRNFNKNLGVVLQFDYDRFGLQGSTLANQETLYNYGCTPVYVAEGYCTLVTQLDGNNHVWSFTLNPTYTFATSGPLGAYAVVGAGFYHKVTNFTEPETAEAYSPFYGYYEYEAEANVDHYTSNAPGVNAGFGVTYKFSRWANERLYGEVRYVLMLNSQRYGFTINNYTTTTYNGYDAYPANSNRTTYIPIKFGLRF